MKLISVCIGCYNEEKNIELVYNRLVKVFESMPDYRFEIIFEDNCSKDNSRIVLRQLAARDDRVKVIFNTRNFGPKRSAKNCCFSASGDLVISIVCDLQDPPELIPQFVEAWEKGYKVVFGQKTKSKENKLKYLCRKIYYKIIDKFSEIEQYNQVTGFGALDKEVYDKIKEIGYYNMATRHLVAELGYPVCFIEYCQEKRKYGKSSFNLSRLFDFSVYSLVSTSVKPLSMCLKFGIFSSVISFALSIALIVCKLVMESFFSWGLIVCLIVLMGVLSINLFFLGLIGQYIALILERESRMPIVVEQERINFDK